MAPRAPKPPTSTPKARAAAPKVRQSKAAAAAATKQRRKLEFSETDMAMARALGRRATLDDLPRGMKRPAHPFVVPQPPPGVVPAGAAILGTINFDEAIDGAQSIAAWAGMGYANYAWSEGLQFLGYPYLAELSQRPEYRRMVEIIAYEMTRKWITLKAKGTSTAKADGTPDKQKQKAKTKRINDLNDELNRLQVRDVFQKLAEFDGYLGRAHLYIDIGEAFVKDDELQTDIGPGGKDDAVSSAKVNKQSPINYLLPVEATWTYPTNYNSNNPLARSWYKPDMWFVMGKQVHASRLLTFIGREVPDILKPAYSFGGLALTQMAKPYVTNWLQTRQSVNDAISGFSTFVLSTSMGAMLQGSGAAEFWKRAAFFDELRNNRGMFMVDKELEDLKNVAMPLGGLHELQAQSQEHMAAVSGIPLVKLLGIQPAGLNASSDGEIRVFYDWIAAYQNAFFRPNLQTVVHFAMRSLWGDIDSDIEFEFEPLWAMDDKEIGDVEKSKAETDQTYVDMGAISPQEVRTRLAGDADSPYHGLDPDDEPDLLYEEEMGLEPPGGRPNPAQAEGEAAEGQKPVTATG